jgi:SLT domain-containing protein
VAKGIPGLPVAIIAGGGILVWSGIYNQTLGNALGSTAYGIFQFLDTTWASVGYTKTSDPVVQIAAGLAYVKQRYGDPVKAWAFHQANGYYLWLAFPESP